MILPKSPPLHFGQPKPPEPTITGDMEMGQHAVQLWRRSFRPPGLRRVVAAARAVEKVAMSHATRATSALATLKSQLEKAEPGSTEHLELTNLLQQMEGNALELQSTANGAGKAPFYEHENLVALHGDILLMVASLTAAVAACVKGQEKFHASMGWDPPTVEYLSWSCSPFLALNSLLEDHARPAIARWAQALELSAQGKPLPPQLDAPGLCWLLFGKSWTDTLKEF